MHESFVKPGSQAFSRTRLGIKYRATKSPPPRDDRNVLQLISAGIQVAKTLKDPSAMEYLDKLYQQTEQAIGERRKSPILPR